MEAAAGRGARRPTGCRWCGRLAGLASPTWAGCTDRTSCSRCARWRPSGLVFVPLRSGEGVPGAARQGLAVRFPGAVGCRYHVAAIPATDPEEDAAVIERINAATPGLVWVGLSTPNQER